MAAALQARKFFSSAAVIIPPKSVWSQIQAIRSKHDRTFARWMPHISVVYPFVANNSFPEAAERLKPVIAAQKPFTIRLDKLSFFQQQLVSSVYTPAVSHPENSVLDLQKAIQSVLPDCNDLVLKANLGYRPLITLGQFDKETVGEQLKQLAAEWKPVEFQVNHLYLVSRNGDVPFEVRHALPFHDAQPQSEFPETPTVFPPKSAEANARFWNEKAAAAGRELRAYFRRNEPLIDRRAGGFTRNVNDATRFEQQTQRPKDPGFKLFVGNLSWNVDYKKLLEVFGPHGATKAFVVKDRAKDRSRGYGFVSFPTEEAMQAALQATTMKPVEIDGRAMQVKLALDRAAFSPEALASVDASAKPAA